MNPFFASLFGQQAAGPMANATSEFPDGYDVVGGRNKRILPTGPSAEEIDKYADMRLDNTEAIRRRDAALLAAEQESAAGRRGMFGTKGTLRDVLGVLGDAFLVQSGNKAIYMPQREQERFGDAMAGSTIDPMAAIERAMGINPEAAMAYRKDFITGENAAERNEIDRMGQTRLTLNDARKEVSQVFARASALGTPEAMEAAARFAQNTAQSYGIPLNELGVTENMSQAEQEVLAGRSATSSQNLNIPLREEQLAQGRDRLAIALRGVKNQEARTRIAEEMLGLRRDTQMFNEMIDLMGLDLRAEEEKGRNNRAAAKGDRKTLRDTSSSSSSKPRPSVSNW